MWRKNQIRGLSLGLILVLAALILAGCGAKKNDVNAELTSYKITLDKTTVSPGKVTFHIKNLATDLKHEFVVVQTNLDAANLPLGADGNVDENQIQSMGEQELEPGASADLVIDNMPAGHYVIICNQPGHYMQKMYTNFTVQ